jgi:hypothetical protein
LVGFLIGSGGAVKAAYTDTQGRFSKLRGRHEALSSLVRQHRRQIMGVLDTAGSLAAPGAESILDEAVLASVLTAAKLMRQQYETQLGDLRAEACPCLLARVVADRRRAAGAHERGAGGRAEQRGGGGVRAGGAGCAARAHRDIA